MNTDLPAEVDLALRKHVERAVRPVKAGRSKKLTMREELLAHLRAIYGEELDQRADSQAALSAALERFGEPAALTAELDASISWIDRLDRWEDRLDRKLHAWFDFRANESWLSFGLRWIVGLGLVNAFLWILLLSVAAAQSRIGDASGFSAAWRCSLLLSVTQPAALLGIRGVYMALMSRRTAFRWLAAVAQAIGWSAFELFVVIAFWWSFTRSLPTNNQQMIFVMRSFLIALPPFLFVGGWLCTLAKPIKDQHAAWTTLVIDE